MAETTDVDRAHWRHLGLPPELLSSSLLSWAGLAEVVDELALRPGDVLADLACGRGGYGLEIARRTEARLIGVDFSAEAIRQARAHADDLGRTAEFRVGDLAATGLESQSITAAVCVDAIQFAEPPAAAYAELARILVPGGRAVLTCWEPTDHAPDLPERLADVDLRAGLAAAGFVDIEVVDRPEWRQTERALWDEAAALDPGDDPALQSFHDEGVRVLQIWDQVRRVRATATTRAPS
ncbi:class I SAM-dependent methyltransferase [Microlunatus speluncae]|uniref:class I SAM-dependent methyltransferase n=1 Tax=Microlunatus speluncae TaxID=2594267 RepID=UPI001266364A|nr:class I SAM-dependent methyltransferase [Microlunatus speluncae]